MQICGACLREGFGHYPLAPAGDPPEHALCKLHTIEFCMRIGESAGFISKSEVACGTYIRRGVLTEGRIDVVWYWSGRPICSIEVEGRDVAKESIRNDVEKFRSIGTPCNAIVLFQVENDLQRPKGRTGRRTRYTGRVRTEISWLGFRGVEVLLDSEIFAAGGAEKWVSNILP